MLVVRLSPSRFHLLRSSARTENPTPWVAAVEHFVYDQAPVEAVRDGVGQLFMVNDDAGIIAFGAHRPHPNYAAELFQALVVLPERRSTGHGDAVLAAALTHVCQEAETDHVVWLVDASNDPMLVVSNRVGEPQGVSNRHEVFVHDCT